MQLFSFFKNTFLHPLQEFIHDSRSIGIILLSTTALSLFLVNLSATSNWYQSIWHFSFDGTESHHIHIGFLFLPNSVLTVINDFLMAIFFFLAGMEIKRELAHGELSSFKQSLLPVVAAIGGMIVPAIIYSQFNKGTPFMSGWAVPMATDIAFTLGVASLLGKRIPLALKVFITALAIIDDLGAIVVIALFYGGQLQLLYLILAACIMGILWFLNKKKISFGWYNWILGILLWYAMYNSGIHATIAGVLFAFMIPENKLTTLEMKFHSPVYFLIMPLFALANTAIVFPINSLQSINTTYSWGILFGLLVGKPLGIVGACFFVIKNKFSDLPIGTNWYQVIGAGILAAIGFTMSIFLSTLAFANHQEQDIAKIAVLITSLLAIIIGYIWFVLPKNDTGLQEQS
ncbi:MAG: Na+/H+ antiporter NhaA [Sphingobacteriia bacterium]|nr:MAG: Na+/H+ antiporter NhaA [Sphingobacteriia bacterium]